MSERKKFIIGELELIEGQLYIDKYKRCFLVVGFEKRTGCPNVIIYFLSQKTKFALKANKLKNLGLIKVDFLMVPARLELKE